MEALKRAPSSARQLELEERLFELELELAEFEVRHERDSQYFAQLEAVIDSAPLAVYLKDAQHKYLLVNREYERLAGAKRSDIVGHDDFELFPPPVAELFRAQDEEVVARARSVEFRETIPLPDGVHSFITSKFPLRTSDGALFGVAGVCTEITALAAAQQQLEAAQADLMKKERLATLGELAAVLAHEVRNPLAVIFNAVATLKRTSEPGEQGRLMLDVIHEESERLERMVSALLDLARPEATRLSPTPVLELVRSSIDAARSTAEPVSEVRLQVPQPLPLARLDEQKVHQALVNLVSNAVQATGRRGPVQVRVTVQDSMLRFDVIDDGDGVPMELRERVFAPFFTGRARGTGLGLAVVRRVAEAHHGSITIETTPGGGATFVLKLPL
ncbi:MAG: ATP-binding protein [Archangium sp.]|nr:ATP-binding protein [Archangium sp.]